jgi:superoxide dismutase
MFLQDLIKQQNTLHAKIVDQIENDTQTLQTLADNMAECASNMQGQGYSSFINARENFLSELQRIKGNYLSFVNTSLLYTSTRQ